jgi:tetratricopeptide (TPR) repeat protein
MRWILFLLVILLPQAMVAQEAIVQFEQANQLYRNGDVQKAAQMYEQIIKNGYESPVLYYNLGNACFKSNNIPSAILNYERAKRLAPHDEDVTYNLRLANLKVIDKIEPIPQLFFVEWWRGVTNLLSADGWSTVMIIALWCAAVCGAVFMLARSFILQRLSFFLVLLSMVVSVLAFVWIRQRIQQELDQQSGVVFATSVSVKSAPDEQSTDLFVLHEGVKVELLDNVGTWRKIRLADGKIGWLSDTSIQII